MTWQWSRRRSLTPSTKRVSHRGSLLKGVAVQGVLYQSILNAKLTGRKKLGRKMLEVQCEVSTVSDDLGCHVICWCWSTVFSEVHSQRSHVPGNFRALHASFCWQALWRCWYHFPTGLGTCPHCQRCQKLVQWPWCYCAWLASKLAWPEPQRESMEYCEEEDERHQTQQCRWPDGRYQSNLGFITPEQCHRLIVSMSRRIDAVIHAKGDPTKYWVHRNEHTFQKPDISV